MRNLKITGLPAGKTIAFFVVVILVITIRTPVAGQEIDTEKLDDLFNYLQEQNEAMGSLAIAKNGEVIYSKSIGYRFLSEEEKIPSDTDTKYRIWSVTKTYTATMILQLIEEGKLELSTNLVTYFPEIPLSEKITIEHMLSHKSGIHDFTKPDPQLPPLPEGETQEDMMKKIARFKPDFQPGDKFEYSNSNYLLLGYIIEKLDGESYGKSLQNRISSRIGATDTYFGLGSLDSIENKSFSYQFEHEKWIAVSEGNFSGLLPGGAGSIVSTPTDMVLFIESLFTEKLISKSSLEKMTDISEFYGLGIFKMPYNEETGFGHTGGYIASHSDLSYYPEEGLAIAYCTNGQAYRMEDILNQVLAICYNKDYILPHKRQEMQLNEKQLLEFVGVYQTPAFKIYITYEDNKLRANPEGRPKVTLLASKENTFFTREMDLEIEFNSDETGEIDRLDIIQAGNKVQAIKIKK